ncbi:COX15/CtaA family protein [Pseudactinotalea suaedae]|uniref:COX15/CtaA family protein n=1 Tax=Pseudactinotalea suaedae TaxID=1524924 RepID=UPI001390FDEC|nr:COX15/CtaA family protein [Pseudactinotalea suaedae]
MPAAVDHRTSAGDLRRPSSTPLHRWTGVAVLANLIGQVLIIVTGGAVRLTGSGLGCSTWPQCEPGSFTPVFHEELEFHVFVEYGNRLVGVLLGLVGISLAVLMTLAVRRLGRSRRLRTMSYAVIAVVVLQGLIGGVSVWMDLHPAVVGSHFLISAALLVLSTVLAVTWFEPDSPTQPVGSPWLRRLAWTTAVLAGVVVVLGVVVTGAGPHSGDDEIGYRFAVDPYLVARAHAVAVWVFLAALAATIVAAVRARPALPDVRRWTLVLLLVTLLQGVIGYVQFFTGLPEILVGAHMLGAALLIVATTRTMLTLREHQVEAAPVGQGAQGASAGRSPAQPPA